ncbi:hypothetical protein QOL99_01805 [Deinococcus sp. MIMF12]|uniref:Uncharacterized protein n=1 Tax=Deinococcus rhizophilus TaxID=3049544 RepID=A0ABT7JCW2_9DEIO|nr:hypothetical protein [Deinococcus rhizophilus]MDL2342876.1 hypothetical protein [Deinococcus rhizophilus]
MSLYDRSLVSYTALFKRYLDLGVDAVLLWQVASAYHHGDSLFVSARSGDDLTTLKLYVD